MQLETVERVPGKETSGTGLQQNSLASLRDSNRFNDSNSAVTGGADCVEKPLMGMK